MKNSIKAKELLENGHYTCVLYNGKELYTSYLRGVKPLMEWLEGDVNLKDFSAADKVIGKATAFLYVLLEVKSVYAKVISSSALNILNRYNITIQYDKLVENIVNRRGDGICPFEAAVLDVERAQDAYIIIKQKLENI